VLADGGEQLVVRALVEDVVDDLDRVDVAGAHEREGGLRLVVVDRHAEEADLALLLERLDGLEPVALPEPVVVPDVELLDVDRLEAEVAQARLGPGADVVARERRVGVRAGRGGPAPVLRRDLRRHVDGLGPVPDRAAHELLRVAVAVGERRVDEGQSEVDRAVQRAQRRVVVGADPHALADAPGAVADLGHLDAGVAKLAVVHGS
jgi:hypothetical protein